MGTNTMLMKDLLLAVAPPSQYQGNRLRDMVQDELSKINYDIVLQPSDSGCLFADAGDFLARATMLLAQLATGIVHSKHMDAYIVEKTDEMEEDHEFSQLDVLDYLDAKHASIKRVGAQLQDTASQVRATWQMSPPPVFERVPSVIPGPETPTHQPVPHPDSMVHRPTTLNPKGDVFPRHEDHRHTQMSPAVELAPLLPSPSTVPLSEESTLSVRGKGQHVCPHGLACTKGGIGSDGNVLVFERNSAFRAHLQKHEKKFRCRIPGCTNRTGFARIDQLRRHEQNVQHGPAPPTMHMRMYAPTAAVMR